MPINTSAEQKKINVIKQYVDSKYPTLSALLTKQQYRQLSWNDDQRCTNQASLSHAIAPNVDLPFQTKRLIARLYFLNIIRHDETMSAHEKITAGQTEHPLSLETFTALAAIIKNLNETEFQQLWVACLVSVNDIAKDKAHSISNFGKVPADSVAFLAKMMTKNPKIYPAADELIAKDRSAKEGFRVMFNSGHVRHMQDLEGGEEMFDKLRAYPLNAQGLNLCLAYWLMDITSLSVHTKNNLGSQYLTEPVGKMFLILQHHLIEFINNPEKLILKDYVHARMRSLDFPPASAQTLFGSNAQDVLLKVKLAALCRIFAYDSSAMREIHEALTKLKKNTQSFEIIQRMFNPLGRNIGLTPTYIPVVLGNLYKKTGCYKTSLTCALPIIAKIMNNYEKSHLAAIRPDSEPLNFNKLASNEYMDWMLSKTPVDICINHLTGDVSFMEAQDLHKPYNITSEMSECLTQMFSPPTV